MLAISCKSVEFQKNPPFEVLKVSYNHWAGGQPGVSGINIKIDYKTEFNVVFDSIYFQSRKGTIDSYTEGNDTFIIGRISTSSPKTITPDNTTTSEQPKEKFPFKLAEDEAVLLYTHNSKTFYYKISNIEETDTKFFQ